MKLEKVSLGDIPAYYGGPKDRPAVIVVQEWWGVTPEIKQQAQYIGERGKYWVMIPDLYRGKIGVNAEEAKHLASELDFGQAVEDIKQAADWLKANGAAKVAVIGFCQGGSLAFLATENGNVDAAVPFYGIPKQRPGHPEKVKVPVQAHVGSDDKFFPAEEVKKYVDDINAAGGNAQVFVYPGEGHAFMNKQSDSLGRMKTAGIPEGSQESQELAWSRTFDFLKQHLG